MFFAEFSYLDTLGAYIDPHTHTYIYTHTHIHTYTHTYTHPFFHSLFFPSLSLQLQTQLNTACCEAYQLPQCSSLRVAVAAGAHALPTLSKMMDVMRRKKADWTLGRELPVEVSLPEAFEYHSVFVCPVSRERSSPSNPPMLLVCGHVISRTSLRTIAKSPTG
jgi:E3 ubiquitin-protein transferase RMND5